ncbi:MAG: ABC transporter ATP-binding protein [Acidimicrobiia bacterium]|nr:ABC transporter ATP-binding protein [Acidimicrobiia bacterium]
MPDVAVSIEQVSKRFRLYHEHTKSLKERMIRAGRNSYEEFYALRDVSIDVHRGETFGLFGHNGSGKSTLLKCVAGTLRPTTGRITSTGRMAALLELGAGMHPELTGRENIYMNGSILGLSRIDVDRVFDDIVGFAELEQFVDLQLKHYSSGMAARLGFGVAVHVDPEILLIDEVLSVGDESFQRKCLERIKHFQREGRTIFVVTHAADTIRQIGTRAAVLDQGHLLYVGDPGEAVRSLRDSLMRRGVAVPDEGDGADGVGASPLLGTVRFTNISVEGADGRSFVRPGDHLRITVDFEAEDRHDDLIVALNLNDDTGVLMVGVNSELLSGEALVVPAGPSRYVFDLGPLALGAGMYEVAVGLHNRAGVQYDQRMKAALLQVASNSRFIGRLHTPIEGELVPLGSRDQSNPRAS